MAAACREPNARKTQAAKRFGVSRSFVGELLRREREAGSLAPKPASGGPERLLSADDQAWLVAHVDEHADATLAELGQAWQAHAGRSVCQTCIWDVLNEHQLRRKKSLHATERDTPRVRTARTAHVAKVCTRPDVARFHFLDETALRLDYTRRYARARGGQRVGGAIPLNRGKSLTLIGALSVNGLGALQVVEDALNQHRFA